MPRPRFEKLPEEKQHKILYVAAKEFGNHGFSGASLNHILEECGVSKGAAYYYFDSKADLFGAVIQHFFNHLVQDTGFALDQLDQASFWEMIRALYHQSIVHTREEEWMSGLAKAVWKLSPAERNSQEFRAALEKPLAWLRALVRRGQALGVVRTDLPEDLLCEMVVALDEVIDRWMGGVWDTLGQAELLALVDVLVDTLERMLEPREDT